MCVDWQSYSKENMDVTSSKFCQHEKPAAEADRRDAVMSSAQDRCDARARHDVVVPDIRHIDVGDRVDVAGRVDVGGRVGDNRMKRKTLRHCDDGLTSVSESFTDSETTEAGTQFIL